MPLSVLVDGVVVEYVPVVLEGVVEYVPVPVVELFMSVDVPVVPVVPVVVGSVVPVVVPVLLWFEYVEFVVVVLVLWG